MGKIKALLITFVAVAMTLGLAGLASAATITCGACHSSPPVNSDNCTSNARALHGTHVNYSSASYPENVASNGKCSYCHTAVPDAKGIASTTHNNNFINITGGASAKAVGLRYTKPAKTCANACHKNDAVGTWGNYTATTVGTAKLSCGSCHDDSTVGNFAGAAAVNAHRQHVISNCTTPAGLMSQAANAGCAACHPDDRADLWKNGKADDGSKKAYPHAVDGTNVSNSNLAVLSNAITSATKAGTNTTCATTCHPRGAAVIWGTVYTAGGTASCNLCHYWAATPLDTSNTGTGSLSFGHNAHIKTGYQFACTECHPNRTDRDGHATKLPISGNYNVQVVRAGMGYSKAAKTCSNTGGFCHGAGTTGAWGTTGGFCAACHYYPGATAGLGSTWATGNGHNVRHDFTNQHMKAGSFTATSFQTDTFASAIADVNKCGLCHRNIKAKHPNGTNFAHLSSAAGYNTACGTFTFSTGGVGNGSTTTCANVKCHSGKTTPVWW